MSARARFEGRLEQVRLRAMLAIERSGERPDPDARAELERQLAAIEAAVAGSGDREARLGLPPDELAFLWTVVAVSIDPRVAAHALVLGGHDARRGASLALHALVAGLDGERARSLALALDAGHPLLADHVLVAEADATGATRGFVAPHRTCAFLAGDDAIDAAVAQVGERVVVPAALVWSDAQRAAQERIAQALPERVVIIVEGPAGVGRRAALASVVPTVAIDARRIAPTAPALEVALAALRRETALTGALPVVANIDDLVEGESGTGPRLRALARVLDRLPGAIALTTSLRGMELQLERRILRIELPAPDTATRRMLWSTVASGDELDTIAMRYRLGAGGIARAAASARTIAAARGAPVAAHDLVEGIRNDIAERLGGLAQRVEVRQSWDDLVLTSDTLDQVRALIARVRLAHLVLDRWGFAAKLPRGIGVAGLFSGPPGTGKTMVAGLIAKELDLELYQVDLSKVVSKWVGETEKQLSRIFDAAEAGHALLLFDEADSLFAKRTEVKAAIDRYANLEVNYLLQRIEAFGGITILTTNMDTSIDPALRRRLAGHISFWPPDEAERQTLWRRMIAKDAPVAEPLDLEALAVAFPDMTGANIRNAVISAAFLAASEESPITQAHLERAGKGEYRAMGRVLGGK